MLLYTNTSTAFSCPLSHYIIIQDKDFGLWTSYSDDTLMALSCVQYSEVYTNIVYMYRLKTFGVKVYISKHVSHV